MRSISVNRSSMVHLRCWLVSRERSPSACTRSYVLGYVGKASHLKPETKKIILNKEINNQLPLQQEKFEFGSEYSPLLGNELGLKPGKNFTEAIVLYKALGGEKWESGSIPIVQNANIATVNDQGKIVRSTCWNDIHDPHRLFRSQECRIKPTKMSIHVQHISKHVIRWWWVLITRPLWMIRKY